MVCVEFSIWSLDLVGMWVNCCLMTIELSSYHSQAQQRLVFMFLRLLPIALGAQFLSWAVIMGLSFLRKLILPWQPEPSYSVRLGQPVNVVHLLVGSSCKNPLPRIYLSV